MAGPGCVLDSQRERFENNEFVKEFAKYNQISIPTAIDWIQSWQVKNKGKDFIEEAAKEHNKYRTFNGVTDNRKKEFYKNISPTARQFGMQFTALHRDLSKQQIFDAIQLIEAACYGLYRVYEQNGFYTSIEQYLSQGELGLYDKIYDILNSALIPDEDGDYVMDDVFENPSDPKSSVVLTQEQAELLRKVLSRSNFDTLWHLFKINAKSTLGITIGHSEPVGDRLQDIGDEIDEIDSEIDVLEKGENDENSHFNYEESHREAWQEVKEFIKPMKQLSQEVRRMISRIRQYDTNGKIATSSFGVTRFESPHVIHRMLAQTLLGVSSESQMIEWLKKAEATTGNKQISDILSIIDSEYTLAQALAESDLSADALQLKYESEHANSVALRTKLFQDMQRKGMAYAVAKIKRKGKEIWESITFINTASSQLGNQLWQGYRNMLNSKKNIISSEFTLFNEEGDLKKGAVGKAGNIANAFEINTNIEYEKSKNYAKERTEDFFNQLSIEEQRKAIVNALKALGIPYNINNITKLLRSSHPDKYKLVSNLYDTFDFIYADGTRKDGTSMINALTISKEGQWTASRAMSQILRIANQDNMIAQSVFRMSGSYINPTKGFVEYQTAQLRGFLIDMFDDIQQAKDKTLDEDNFKLEYDSHGNRIKTFKVNYVQKYIEDHFLQDPMFVEYEETTDSKGNPKLDKDGNPVKPKYRKDANGDPIIRNPWLRELWKNANSIESLKSPNSFINQFKHYQFVGSQKDADEGFTTNNADWKTWEDFNGIQHMGLLMNAYVQAYRTDEVANGFKDDYADYPTFILGDSGKLKFIRSRRYKVHNDKGESVMKHLKNVVLQEVDFAKNMYDFQTDLINQGYKPIPQMPLSKLMVEYPNGSIYYRIQSFPEINDLLHQKALENGVDFSQGQAAVGRQLTEILNGNLDEWLSKIMQDRFEEFKEKCKREGVLKPQTVKKKINDNTTIEYEIYPQLPLGKDSGYAWKTDGASESQMDNEKELNRFLEDFYYNSTLAMINQIQMVSLSPAFYKNSVEMQKRMKQIHANGKKPSLEAIDRYGRPYMIRNGVSDTNMEYILFNDVIGNPSQAQNEDFMNAVAYTHGRYSQQYYQFLAANPNATIEEKDAKAIEIGKQSRAYKTFAATSYTDGQGYRTLEGYRKIKGALGQWSQEDENNYRRILEIRRKHEDGSEWSSEEQIEVANMVSRWQPIKPFVYGMQEIQQVTDGVGRKVRIPTQIKCSECLIIPELLPKNSRLRTMVQYMEDEFLDCGYYDSCVKVGAFGQTETQYSNNPNNKVSINEETGQIDSKSGVWSQPLEDELKDGNTFDVMSNEQLTDVLNGRYAFLSPRRHKLSYEYYVEQNAVTEHTYNSRTIGTQLRKIFFDGLSNFELDENGKPTGKLKDYSGYIDSDFITLPNGKKAVLQSKEQLIKFYNSLHCANVLSQFDEILKIIENDETLSRELQKIAQKSNNEQLSKLVMYAVHQSFTGNYEFSLPLFENSLEHDAAATLISIFRKATTQQLIQGGSLVQASAYGIGKIRYIKSKNKYVEDNLQVHCDKNHNILYSECEVPFAQEYTDKYGRKVKLRFEDWCNEDGTLKTDEAGNILLEKAFPGSTEMICYRIPSEKDYSAVVLKVKRFTKPIEGGIIRLPVQITSITGADFDIDKMFLMRPQYVQQKDVLTLEDFIDKNYANKKQRSALLGSIWEEVYVGNYFGTDGENIREALRSARFDYMRKQGISKEEDAPSLNLFWDQAVAKHPDAFKGKDNKVFTDKQSYFRAAAEKINPQFKKDIIDRFDENGQYKWYTYDYNKPVNQQESVKGLGVKTDVVVRNNMMLHLLKKRLQDPQTMLSRATPGGFKNAENAAEDIRYTAYADESYINDNEFNWERFEELKNKPDPNASMNYADPFTLVEYNKQNQIANKLVGTFANLNSFKQMLNSLEDVTLTKPIMMFGRRANSLVKLSEEDLRQGRNATLYVAEMLAAAVDSVKNPTLKFLNITQSTAYVAGLMAMAGFTHREIGIFLNQPIVKEVTNYCEQNNCGLTAAIKAILQQYYTINGQKQAIQSETEYASKLTEGQLLRNLVGGEQKNSIEAKKNDMAFMNYQFSVLSALQHLTDTSLVLKQYVSASKMTSSNSIQSTYGSIYNVIQSAENLNNVAQEDVKIILHPYSNKSGITSPINTELDTRDKNYMDQVLDSVFPIEQVIYDVVKRFRDETQKFFPYQNNIFKSAREFFKTANKKESVLTAKTIDAIHRYVQNWCLQNLPNCPSLFGGATIEKGSQKYPVKTYFLHIFPKEFKRFIDTHAEEYPTLHSCLTIDENNRIILNYGFNRDNDKDAFTAEWRNLIQNNGTKVSNRLNVGTALYFYNYYASKFNFGSTTFDHLMPQDQLPNVVIGYQQNFGNRTLEPITYRDALDFIKSNAYSDIDDDFKILFLRENYNNNELVKQIYNYEQAAYFGSGDVKINTSDNTSLNTFDFLKIKENKDDGTITYPLAIHVNDKVYIAMNNKGEVQNTVNMGDTITYKMFSTELEDKSSKTNEENIPIEGTFLEPISWSELENLSTENVAYDIVSGLLNNMITETAGDELEIHKYLDFCKDLISNLKRQKVEVNSVYLVQESFKTLQNAYNSYNNGKVLTSQETEQIRQANAVTILQTFIDVLCPDIDKVSGEQRAKIYDIVISNYINNEGNINIDNFTFEDVKQTVVAALLANRLEIEETIKSATQAQEMFEILKHDEGKNPLLPNEDNEIQPLCRK